MQMCILFGWVNMCVKLYFKAYAKKNNIVTIRCRINILSVSTLNQKSKSLQILIVKIKLSINKFPSNCIPKKKKKIETLLHSSQYQTRAHERNTALVMEKR